VHPTWRTRKYVRRVCCFWLISIHRFVDNIRNPLGSAVAMTALSVLIDERLADRAMKLGEFFRSSIRALNSPLVKEVRGRGLLNAVVIDEDASKKQGKGRTAWQFCLLLKSRGVLAKPTHVNMYVLIFHLIYPNVKPGDC